MSDQPSQPLPPLTHEDAALLYDFLSCAENPYTLAHKGHNFLRILAFTARPDIAAWLTHARRLRTHARREAALITLEHLLSDSEDPIERRRIATAILRETNPRRRPRPARTTRATAGSAPPSNQPDPTQPAPTETIPATTPTANTPCDRPGFSDPCVSLDTCGPSDPSNPSSDDTAPPEAPDIEADPDDDDALGNAPESHHLRGNNAQTTPSNISNTTPQHPANQREPPH